MSDSFILPMDTTNDSLELIGGKGRSLAKMSNAGFDVPYGFHLNADAYRAFIAENNLQDQIVALGWYIGDLACILVLWRLHSLKFQIDAAPFGSRSCPDFGT